MLNHCEEEMDHRTEREKIRDRFFGRIVGIFLVMILITGAIFIMILENSYFFTEVWPKGWAGKGFALVVYFLLSFALSIAITWCIKKVYMAIRKRTHKFREYDIAYKAADYLEWKENRKNVRATILYSICAIFGIAIMVFGPAIISGFSNRGEILILPLFVGSATSIIPLIIIFLLRNYSYGQEDLFLLPDVVKGLTITLTLYFVFALIFSYARLWTIGSYWVVCIFLGFLGSILSINLVMSWAHKREKAYGKNSG